MPFMTLIRGATLAACALAFSTAALAQAWPAKPVRIVVGFAAGGITDQVARAIGNRLSKDIGQPVLVENRSGAGGTLAADMVAKAPPDGYTLLLGEPGGVTINASIMKLPYDPVRDLAAVAQVVSLPMILVASPSTRTKSLKDLVATHAGKPIAYGTPGTGTIQHLTMVEFARVSGVKFEHAPYRGGAPVMVDVVGNHLPLGMVTVPTALPMLQAGTAVPLGIVARSRSPLLPQVPTFTESGFQFTQDIWQGFFVPAATPRPLVEAIAKALHKAAQSPDVEKPLNALGASVAVSGPAEFQKMVHDEVGYWARLVKEAGIPRE